MARRYAYNHAHWPVWVNRLPPRLTAESCNKSGRDAPDKFRDFHMSPHFMNKQLTRRADAKVNSEFRVVLTQFWLAQYRFGWFMEELDRRP